MIADTLIADAMQLYGMIYPVAGKGSLRDGLADYSDITGKIYLFFNTPDNSTHTVTMEAT